MKVCARFLVLTLALPFSAAIAQSQTAVPVSPASRGAAPPAVSAQDSSTGIAFRVDQRPDCASGPYNAACQVFQGVFATPFARNGNGHRSLITHDLQTYGPSINFGNSGGWTITHLIEAPHVVFGTSGIDQYEGANIVKNGTGDLAGLYFYVYGGGRAAQSDEGVTGLTVESGEIAGYFHGSVSGDAKEGATSLTLAKSATALHNWNYTCVGCVLLDISKGSIAGSLNGKSTPFNGSFLNQLPTSAITVAGSPAPLPLTRAWCTTLTAIPPTETAGLGTSRTVACTLGAVSGETQSFKAGSVVSIAGRYYPEQVSLVNAGPAVAGVQSLTLLARNPNPAGSFIFQGGVAGQFLSFDANLAFSGFRSSYYVFGSLDGTNLIYGSQVAGDLKAHTLPRMGLEAETNSSGFHLYPGAEIVANSAQPSAPTLEPNSVAWQPGDLVENPRFMSAGGHGIRDLCSQFTPSDDTGYSNCLSVTANGPAVTAGYKLLSVTNANPFSFYRQGGGPVDPPDAVTLGGTYGDLIRSYFGPSQATNGYNAVINITHTAGNDSTPFNLFALPTGGIAGTTKVTYDPATRLIGFPQGLVAATIGTSGNCSSAGARPNCGSASSGSFALPAGAASVLVSTSAVTGSSQIQITPDASLDERLGVSCNKNPASAFAAYGVSARSPGHSFTLSVAPSAGPTTAPNCYNFTIIN